jgi:hypothetical protein
MKSDRAQPVSRPTPLGPFRYVVVIGCAAAILAASIVAPGDGVPRTVGIETTVYFHLVGYAGLAAALGHAARSADRRTLLLVAAVVTLYGGGIEAVQGPIPYRTMSGADAATNAVGAALGTGAWRLLGRRFGARFDTDDG